MNAAGRAGRVAVGCLAAAAVLLAGCTPPGLPDPIAPTGLTSVPTSPPAAGTVVIGLDGRAGQLAGFNPYAIADFSPASQAAASLVLPSTFVVAADGTLAPDPDVIDGAEVTSLDPFTVTYTVDRKASWSDGTPVAAEDFSYLWDELLVQPGTVDPAGYRLITQIRSRDAGKTVEVEFAEPFPDWRTLFSPLLPSHLVKDFPGGWGAAFNGEIPLSANRYKMTAYDPVTGQISLARNDKYWGTPPNPSTVVLRLGDQADLLAAYSRGDVQALWFAPTGVVASSLQEAVPADLQTVVATPATIQVVFNTTTGPTADPALRRAIGAGIDVTTVAAALTSGWLAGSAAVVSQVSLPSDQPAASAGSRPLTVDQQAAGAALEAAGYLRNGLYVAKAGEVLRLTLGYPSGNPQLAAAARSIQRQLGDIGIEVDLLADAAPTLIETRIATGQLDLALVTVPRGISDADAAASDFGCPASSALGIGSTAATTAPGSDSDSGNGAGSGSDQGGTTAPAAGTALPRTGNLSGYCEPQTQRLLADALTGQGPPAAADPLLWSDLPVLPLVQTSAVFAVAESLRTVMQPEHPGWVWTGPLVGLSSWPVS